MPYEVLNARVKQKINTEANWIAEEDTFGVIFEGEQAFVKNEDGTPVNFKIGDGTKKFSELAYFIAYYSNITNQKVLPYLNKTSNINISSTFRLNSFLTDIIFLNSFSGDISLKIGTTDGGNELGEIILPIGVSVIGLKKYFEGVQTVYLTGLNSTSFSVYILYVQIDESPAIPPSGGEGTFKIPQGFCGIWEPVNGQVATDVWDFATGLAKPGFGYDNCVLSGTNGTKDRGGLYSKAYKTGDTIGANVGSATNAFSLAVSNLPKVVLSIPYNPKPGRSDNANDRDVMIPTNDASPVNISFGQDVPDAINFTPGSTIDLYYVAIS